MAYTIQIAGLIAFAMFLVTVLVLTAISMVKDRKRGRPRDDVSGGNDSPTSEGPTPGDWDGP